MPIKLIAGLGNPGAAYKDSRHNTGFWMVDSIARKAGVTLRNEARFHGLTARARFNSEDIWLLQPQTFMNRSGRSIAAVARFHKISPDEILIAHDELDLPPGAARLKFGGGSGGHNGLKDISACLATPQYWRLRIGIGHPRDQLTDGAKPDVINFVLNPPRRQEKVLITEAIDHSLSVMPRIISGVTERAMAQLHPQHYAKLP